jgi:hypothetical protein
MRRLALVMASISMLFVPVSTVCSIVALAMGGMYVMPIVLPTFMLNLVMVPINLLTITLNSPGRDPLHYPRRVRDWLRTRRARRMDDRNKNRQAAARRGDPVQEAWHAIVSPPHAMTDARRSRLEDLRFRADIAVDRLGGSLDVGDIDAIVLMQKTLGEVSSAYRAALTVVTTDKGRKAIDRSLEETLDGMVSAAESRLAISDRAVTDRFDAAIQHARSSSARIVDR